MTEDSEAASAAQNDDVAPSPLPAPAPVSPPGPMSVPPPLPVPDSMPSPQVSGPDSVDPPAPDALPDQTVGPVENKLLHVTEQTRTYPCRKCGGEMEFNIGEQRLKCPHCGSVEEIVEGTAPVVENDLRSAMATLSQMASEHTGPQLTGEKEVVCQNCGGHTTFTGTLTATRCPYCATPIQRDDVHEAPARLAVDGVLPFQVDAKTATGLIEKWIKSRWFAPNEFKEYSTTGSFTSLYSAYFTYDADAQTAYRGQRGDNYTVTVGSGENRRTETRTRWRHVSGTVFDSFDDVPVLANDGFDRNRIDALEPWPTQGAQPFTGEYLAGHLCRTYDRGVDECFGVAETRMESSIRETVRRDIGGDHQRISNMQIRWGGLTYKHLLLPIWLLTVVYEQKPFQVFINGVTGEVQGDRPYSKIKIALAVIAVTIIVIVAYIVSQSGK